MTQEELAKKMEKDYSTIGKWENGTRFPIMVDVLKIAELFDISLEDLIYSTSYTNQLDELETLLHQNIGLLTKDDKDTIKFIIEKRIKKERGDNNEMS